jgi:hypothetical protein
MERRRSGLYWNIHSRSLLAIGMGICGLCTVGLAVAPAMAQLPGQEVSQGIPQEFKQKLYETYEGHDFTWGAKEVYLAAYSPTVVDHIASPLAIPEQLRYSEWIDDRTYTYNLARSRMAENRLRPGAKMRGKQVRFHLPEGAQAGMVKILLGTRGWYLGKELEAEVTTEFVFPADLLRAGDYESVVKEISRYLVPAGGVVRTPSAQPSIQPASAGTPAGNPLPQQADDLDRQADQAAAKAQELEQKGQGSGLGGFGGILRAKNSIEAKRWRAKEKQYREQAQQLRQQASQAGQNSSGPERAPSPSGSASPEASVIGCTVSEVTSQMAEQWHIPQAGVYVRDIRPGSFCDRMIVLKVSGRTQGDMLNAPASQAKSRGPVIILRVNQEEVNTGDDFYARHSQLSPRQTVTWTYTEAGDPNRLRSTSVGTWVGSQ